MPPLPLKAYNKPAKTPADLLSHLQARGLGVPDHQRAIQSLKNIGYYRLLIYMRALQMLPSKQFLPNTRFEDVLALYNFDRELRLLCLDAIERIEVALRAAIVNELSVLHGPHFYLDLQHFQDLEGYRGFFAKAARAKYLAISHYHNRYNSPPFAPIWAICEAITFGDLSHLYSGLNSANRKLIARSFGFAETILVSWFRTLNDLRNKCAHHNRLWNANLIVNQPMAAKTVSAELSPSAQKLFYGRAILIVALLKTIEPGSDWRQRLISLLGRYGTIDVQLMGFPLDWTTRVFWR